MVLLNGLSVVAEHVVWVEPDPAWELFAAADLDGDGKDDIVWYNASTGVVYGQLMDGPVRKASGVAHQASSPDWRLVAVGDFDGDGKTDLLWYNTSTGQVWMCASAGSRSWPSSRSTRSRT